MYFPSNGWPTPATLTAAPARSSGSPTAMPSASANAEPICSATAFATCWTSLSLRSGRSPTTNFESAPNSVATEAGERSPFATSTLVVDALAVAVTACCWSGSHPRTSTSATCSAAVIRGENEFRLAPNVSVSESAVCRVPTAGAVDESTGGWKYSLLPRTARSNPTSRARARRKS